MFYFDLYNLKGCGPKSLRNLDHLVYLSNPQYLCVFYMCACMCVAAHVVEGQRLLSGIFLYFSPSSA